MPEAPFQLSGRPSLREGPAESIPARVLKHLSSAEIIDVEAIADAALELIGKGAPAEANLILDALDDALETRGKENSEVAALKHARELNALPPGFPRELRSLLAQAALEGQYRVAAAAIRRHRLVHFVDGPALVATLRRWAPELAKKVLPQERNGNATRIAALIGGIGTASLLALKLTLHGGHVAGQNAEPPAWREPSAGMPLEQMLEAANFMEVYAAHVNERKASAAARELCLVLEESPMNCARVRTAVQGVDQSLQRSPTGVLSRMLAPKLFLLRTLPLACPPATRVLPDLNDLNP